MNLWQHLAAHGRRLGAFVVVLSLVVGLQTMLADRAQAEPGTFIPGVPSVSGPAIVTTRLGASTGIWSPQPDIFAWEWLRDGVPVPGATTSSYKLVRTDVGHRFSVTVTAIKAGYADASVTSEQTAVVVDIDPPSLSDFTAKSVVIKKGRCAKIPLSVTANFSPYSLIAVERLEATAKVINKKGKKIGTAKITGVGIGGTSIASVDPIKEWFVGTFTWCTGDYLGAVKFGPVSAIWTGAVYGPDDFRPAASGKITSNLFATASVKAGVRFGAPSLATKGTTKTLRATFQAYRPESKGWSGLKKGSVVTIQKQVGGAWVKVKTIKIASKGKVKASWTETTATSYRVVWVGSGTKDRAVSAIVSG